MNDRKVAPKIIFQNIKDFVSDEVSKDTATNHYEQFMQRMGFKDDVDNDPEKNFDKKSYAEQQELIISANTLRQQLLDLKTESDDVYNALLLLTYLFPLNAVNSNGKLTCPLSNEILNNKNSFAASNGYQYSRNYLYKHSNELLKLKKSSPRDHQELISILPNSPKRDFWPSEGANGEDLATKLMIVTGVLGAIGGMIAGPMLVATFVSTAATLAGVALKIGLFLGAIVAGSLVGALLPPLAILALCAVGYGIMKLYDKLNSHELNRADKLVFLEPSRPLKKKQVSTYSQQLSQLKTLSAPPISEVTNSAPSPVPQIPIAFPANPPKDPALSPPTAYPVKNSSPSAKLPEPSAPALSDLRRTKH